MDAAPAPVPFSFVFLVFFFEDICAETVRFTSRTLDLWQLNRRDNMTEAHAIVEACFLFGTDTCLTTPLDQIISLKTSFLA